MTIPSSYPTCPDTGRLDLTVPAREINLSSAPVACIAVGPPDEERISRLRADLIELLRLADATREEIMKTMQTVGGFPAVAGRPGQVRVIDADGYPAWADLGKVPLAPGTLSRAEVADRLAKPADHAAGGVVGGAAGCQRHSGGGLPWWVASWPLPGPGVDPAVDAAFAAGRAAPVLTTYTFPDGAPPDHLTEVPWPTDGGTAMPMRGRDLLATFTRLLPDRPSVSCIIPHDPSPAAAPAVTQTQAPVLRINPFRRV